MNFIDFPIEIIAYCLKDFDWDELCVLRCVHSRMQKAVHVVMLNRGMPPYEDWIVTAPFEDVIKRSTLLLNSLVNNAQAYDLDHPIWGPPTLWALWPDYVELFTNPTNPNVWDFNPDSQEHECMSMWKMTRGYRLPMIVARRQLRIFARQDFWLNFDEEALHLWLAFLPRVTDDDWPVEFFDTIANWISSGIERAFAGRYSLYADDNFINYLFYLITTRIPGFAWPLPILRAFAPHTTITQYDWLDQMRTQCATSLQKIITKPSLHDDRPIETHVYDILLSLLRRRRWFDASHFQESISALWLEISNRQPQTENEQVLTVFQPRYLQAYFSREQLIDVYLMIFITFPADQRTFIPDITENFVSDWLSQQTDITKRERTFMLELVLGRND